MLEEIDNLLGAALVNRIDEIAVFDRLNEQNVITLLERSLAEFDQKLTASGIGFKIEEEAKTFLLRNCLDDPTHRVRQLKRVVRNYLEFPIYDLMLSGQLTPAWRRWSHTKRRGIFSTSGSWSRFTTHGQMFHSPGRSTTLRRAPGCSLSEWRV